MLVIMHLLNLEQIKMKLIEHIVFYQIDGERRNFVFLNKDVIDKHIGFYANYAFNFTIW